MRTKHPLLKALLVLPAYFAHINIAQMIPIYGVRPDLLLVFVVCMGLQEGRAFGLLVGVLGGFMCDVMFGREGFFMLVTYGLAGLASGCLQKWCVNARFFKPALCCLVIALGKETFLMMVAFFLRSLLVGSVMLRVAVSAAYTAALMLLAYPWLMQRRAKMLVVVGKRTL